MEKIPKSAAAFATTSTKTLKNEIIIWICPFECHCTLENSMEEIMSKIFEFFTFYGRIWNTDYFRV